MLTKDKLKYLKENTSFITKIDPPYYWSKMNLYVIGDGNVCLPYPDEYAGLRVHIVQEDIDPTITYNCLVLSAKEAEDMVWSDLVKG